MGGRGASSSSGGTQVFKGKTYKTLGSAKIVGALKESDYTSIAKKKLNFEKTMATDFPILNKVPEGWKEAEFVKGTASGWYYQGYSNNKSRFANGGNQREYGYVKKQRSNKFINDFENK